jgi:hypothetical protein
MRVRLSVDVGPRARYVIAKYFGGDETRATREQVRRFVLGALESALREQTTTLRRRQQSHASRLPEEHEIAAPLREPDEKQMSLNLTGRS